MSEGYEVPTELPGSTGVVDINITLLLIVPCTVLFSNNLIRGETTVSGVRARAPPIQHLLHGDYKRVAYTRLKVDEDRS